MAFNRYIAALQGLRKESENRIDSEIEETMRGRGNSARLKDSLEYIIESSKLLDGLYKEEEQLK
jgi:hypothetical protein